MAQGNSPDGLDNLVQWPREERSLEFKCSMNWGEAQTKAKLTKSVLAMANLRDGGHIVLGVERQANDSYVPVGMKPEHLDSFVQDELSPHFSEYADPYIEVTLIKHTVDAKAFCILRVGEFAELPVICKKDGLEKLRRGATYTRSRRMPETVEVPGQAEMREILDLAVEKRSRAFARQADRMGLVKEIRPDQFNEQLGALPENELDKRIRSMGHWRVLIRPTAFERARFQTLTDARFFVASNAVSSGGWQYPLAHDKQIVDGNDWIKSEVEFPPHLETWALFRSGQFLFDFAFAEEYIGTDAWPVHPQFLVPGKGKRYLNILRTLVIVTCISEFAARMSNKGLLEPSALLSIGLYGIGGRELSYMMPKHKLDGRYWSRKEAIEIERTVTAEGLRTGSAELAIQITQEIFAGFGWSNPPRSLLVEEQSRLLRQAQ
jgi:hypothetical protein